MFYIKQHVRDNKGDANVSKMTMIAIVFVVGAILLVLTTSAFRNPINRWFEKVTTGWFASENGMYEADNPFLGYERNANGTYKGVVYRAYLSDGTYYQIDDPAAYHNGDNGEDYVTMYRFDANGNFLEERINTDGWIEISDDGRTIYSGYKTKADYVAVIP